MDNLQNIQGDSGFLHKQFCSGARGKRQQASFTNICRNQLAAETAVFFFFLLREIPQKGMKKWKNTEHRWCEENENHHKKPENAQSSLHCRWKITSLNSQQVEKREPPPSVKSPAWVPYVLGNGGRLPREIRLYVQLRQTGLLICLAEMLFLCHFLFWKSLHSFWELSSYLSHSFVSRATN